VSVYERLQDGQEFSSPLSKVLAIGAEIFKANWTSQEGGGRPLTKGNGNPLLATSAPLVFPRNFNRISAPDANSCFGCHSGPVSGGNGDIVANVFVLGQRFDFASFDGNLVATASATDESGKLASLNQISNSRATLGMFGSGFIEMLARQMTGELRALRNTLAPGQSVALASKGINFGSLARNADGTWDTSGVTGIPAPSLVSSSAAVPPSLIIRPFHQAGNVISIRQFSNNAFNHHHGIQTTERFGDNVDADGDGFVNEMSRAEVTAVSAFQAAMAVPGRVIPRNPKIEAAVLRGETVFSSIGCTSCHVPSLPLDNRGWVFTEPNPYNPAGNLNKQNAAQIFSMDLTSRDLPLPRLEARNGVVQVPAYTDLKLHDITSGPTDANREELDMNQPAGSAGFFAGNGKFLTRKLWGVGRKPNYFHHGKFTTMREAILAHSGEALGSRQAFESASSDDRNAVIEFLRSLQVLPPGSTSLVVDENGNGRTWP
jgi:cytochrome c peroxidase